MRPSEKLQKVRRCWGRHADPPGMALGEEGEEGAVTWSDAGPWPGVARQGDTAASGDPAPPAQRSSGGVETAGPFLGPGPARSPCCASALVRTRGPSPGSASAPRRAWGRGSTAGPAVTVPQ